MADDRKKLVNRAGYRWNNKHKVYVHLGKHRILTQEWMATVGLEEVKRVLSLPAQPEGDWRIHSIGGIAKEERDDYVARVVEGMGADA